MLPGTWLRDLGGDLRWAIRSGRSRPAFTLVAAATLALGIGANSAVFTLAKAHFLTPLPYDNPDRLVLLWETHRNSDRVMTVAPGNYWTWREEATSFAEIAAFNVDTATLSGDGAADRVTASVVSPHFFELLGVEPALGAGLSESVVEQGGTQQVVLSHSLWIRRYGGDPALVGREIQVNGRPHTVLGILPASFRQPERALTWQKPELWRPLALDDLRADFGSRYLRTVARLAPGVSVERAREEMRGMAIRLARLHPESNGGRTVQVHTLDEYLLGSARPALLLLLAAGAAVLLIVCANVANLTLARGEERRREFALRAALGSGRDRLVRQVVIEAIVVALLGGALGAAFVAAGIPALQWWQANFFSGLIDITIDWRVVAFTVVVAIGAGVLFALPLARSASRPDLRSTLGGGGDRVGSSAGTSSTRNILIVAQVAFATTLLVAATLLARSFDRLVHVPPGFEPENVVTFTASAPSARYESEEQFALYHRELSARISEIRGVAAAGMVSDLMFTTENMSTSFAIDGRETDSQSPPTAEFHVFTPGYFEALAIPLVAGVMPPDRQYAGEIPILINQSMASRFWGGSGALGAALKLDDTDPTVLRVTGIVGDILDDGYDAAADPAFFVPYGGMPRRRMSYVVRTSLDPGAMLTELRTAVAGVDPDIPAANLGELGALLAETVARPRAASLIGMTFALIALLLTTSGIYAVLSYAVESRTREIGIRAALGATGAQLVSMVMGQATRLVFVGLLIGTVGALATGRALSSLLFHVQAWDPPSLLAAAVALGAVGSLAAWIPARRAVGIDPSEALRSE